MALIVPGILCAIGLLMILVSGWIRLRHRRDGRMLCPGPRLNWTQRLTPIWFIYRPRCGYDLSGHHLHAAHAVTCPECGRRIRQQRELIRTNRAWRLGRLGGVFILAGGLVHRYPPLTATKVVEFTPTEILLRGEGILGVGTPLEVRDEIRRRALDHQLRDDQICRFVQLLLNDLRDDDLDNNAKDAIEQLAVFGVFCTESLMAALKSEDLQQRALAGQVLRSLPETCVDHAMLIPASVDDLKSDRWPQTRADARWYLRRHLVQATPPLIAALRDGDEEQRRNIAWILRDAPVEGETLQQLIVLSMNDLRDDDRRGNYDDAYWFLHGQRERAEPMLLAALDSDDKQQRDAAVRILRDCELQGEALDRMLRLSVDQLRLGSGVWRTGELVRHLLRNIEAAEPLLLEGMQGDDRRQRLLCAVAAGCGGRVDIMQAAVLILVEHLGDNDLEGDAIAAARAIWGFGIAAVPLLQPYRASMDEQQRQTVEYIVRRLTTTDSLVALQHELPLARLTQARVDALALEPTELRMPDFPE